MASPKLFMVLLGSSIPGRNTEQHDIFFGIEESISALFPAMKAFWPEAKGKLHVDVWREVTAVDNYEIKVVEREQGGTEKQAVHLYFINLGGYRKNEFEEYHYKVLSVAKDKAEAIAASKQTTFYRHCGFKGAPSHIDDKYGIDVDDIYHLPDLLSVEEKRKYAIQIIESESMQTDTLHAGYLKMPSDLV